MSREFKALTFDKNELRKVYFVCLNNETVALYNQKCKDYDNKKQRETKATVC